MIERLKFTVDERTVKGKLACVRQEKVVNASQFIWNDAKGQLNAILEMAQKFEANNSVAAVVEVRARARRKEEVCWKNVTMAEEGVEFAQKEAKSDPSKASALSKAKAAHQDAAKKLSEAK